MNESVHRRREHAIDAVMVARGVSASTGREAIADAYDLGYASFGPFITQTVADMLVDLRADVAHNPGHQVVFCGRDGHSLAVAARQLDPEFFARHCREVVLSRVSVEAAVQDLERSGSMDFSPVADYRATASRVDPATVVDAYVRLDDYLDRVGLRVGRPDSSITLVDTSFKGSVQELLSAIYPETTFTGRYMSFGAAPHDPHPGSKFGYAVHLEAHETHEGSGKPFSYIDDERLVFATNDGIAVIEDLCHGARTSAAVIGADGPEQRPGRHDSVYSFKLNPLRVDDRYVSPVVREAVTSVLLTAISDRAKDVAKAAEQGVDWRSGLAIDAATFRSQVHRWTHGQAIDPTLGRLLDSFASRAADATDERWQQIVREAAAELKAVAPRRRGRHLDTPDLFDYPNH